VREKQYGGDGIVRDTTFYGGRQNFPALNVPSQCPLVLPVKIYWRRGRALGREGDKALGNGLCYEYRREVDQSPFYRNFHVSVRRCIRVNFDVIFRGLHQGEMLML
jgi:hypothetical protein